MYCNMSKKNTDENLNKDKNDKQESDKEAVEPEQEEPEEPEEELTEEQVEKLKKDNLKKFKKNVTEYIKADNKIRELRKDIKALNAIITDTSEPILKYLTDNRKEYQEVEDGKLMMYESVSKGSLKNDLIKDALKTAFQDNNLENEMDVDTKAEKIMEILENSREGTTKTKLKRTFNKGKGGKGGKGNKDKKQKKTKKKQNPIVTKTIKSKSKKQKSNNASEEPDEDDAHVDTAVNYFTDNDDDNEKQETKEQVDEEPKSA